MSHVFFKRYGDVSVVFAFKSTLYIVQQLLMSWWKVTFPINFALPNLSKWMFKEINMHPKRIYAENAQTMILLTSVNIQYLTGCKIASDLNAFVRYYK